MSAVDVGFPSDDFPGPTPFRLRIPAHWRGFETPDALLGVGAPEPIGRFRTNVVVNTHRIRRSPQPDLDLELLLTGDDALPGVEILDDDRDAGPPFARRRRFTYDGPENVRLLAVRLLVVVPVGAHLADVVSAVGTVAHDGPRDAQREVRAVVASLAVARRPTD